MFSMYTIFDMIKRIIMAFWMGCIVKDIFQPLICNSFLEQQYERICILNLAEKIDFETTLIDHNYGSLDEGHIIPHMLIGFICDGKEVKDVTTN